MGATRLPTTSDALYTARHARYLKRREQTLARAKARYAIERPARQAMAQQLREAARQGRLTEKRNAAYANRQQDVPTTRWRRLREYVKSLKEGRACLDCGGSFPPYVMDFDHVRGTKSIGVSDATTFKKINEEVAKCDLVCANCHRIRTFTRSPIPE